MQRHDVMNLMIRQLEASDIPLITNAFAAANWPKPAVVFEQYYQEQLIGERIVWVVFSNNELAGYVTLCWHSKYPEFANRSIPEIMDLNVLPSYRKIGIGSMLLAQAEKAANTKSKLVGLGVGLYAGFDGGYGAAQRLYIKRGYIPDGHGVTYDYQPAKPGELFRLDDDLVLWLVKELIS